MTLWRKQWEEIREQLQRNPRLRLALWAILAILWIYALLLASDALPGAHAEVRARQSELARLQKIEPIEVWRQREADAQSQLRAVEAMGWDATKSAVASAEIQDWLRQLATKSGLGVKELRAAGSDAPSGAGAAGAAASASVQTVRMRATLEFNPMALAALMHELGQVERGVVIERLQLKLTSKPSVAEMDLRIPLRNREATQ